MDNKPLWVPVGLVLLLVGGVLAIDNKIRGKKR